MEKIILSVQGMSCGHCEKAVVNALADIGATATADSKSGIVEVQFDAAVLTLDAIKAELDDAGYAVV